MRDPAQADQSQVPATLIPNPDLSNIPVARERTFVFGSGASQTTVPVTSFITGAGNKTGPWGVWNRWRPDADAFGRLSAAPKFGTREVWTLVNGGGGWDHPIHIHFEEGQILARNGSVSNVPAWEHGRKDVYRLRPGGSVTLTMQFRDWGGMFMEHCHNTVHEDNAMLLRWEIDDTGRRSCARCRRRSRRLRVCRSRTGRHRSNRVLTKAAPQSQPVPLHSYEWGGILRKRSGTTDGDSPHSEIRSIGRHLRLCSPFYMPRAAGHRRQCPLGS